MTSSQHSQTISKLKAPSQGNLCQMFTFGLMTQKKTKQILILELKSTTNAHNAGNTKEGMIAQVKRYAHDFYKHPHKTLNWTVNTEQVQYTGIILARKSDIDKELTSNSFSGGYKPIPFLANSYYFEDNFF